MVRTPIALALLVALAGCTGTDEATPDPATAEPSSSTSTSTPTPEGGPIDDPTVAEPTLNLLDWNDSGVEAGTRYARGAEWEALGSEDGSSIELTADGRAVGIAAGGGRTISEVLMTADWAVVVRQDTAETDPSEVDVIDLATGEQTALAGPEPASGGSWALTGGDLYYPTYVDGAYCLATSALADSNGEDGWCAPEGTGFSGLTASDRGVGIMTFDDARPACRTLHLYDNGTLGQLEGATGCIGWDVAAAADGYAWSEVPKPRRQEEAHFYASAYNAFFDLGPGSTGTLTPCGDSLFFVRDPESADEPARLMRWTAQHTLEIAYESPSAGNAFLDEPTCGGDVITVPSYGEEGDELVWARVT